jgi:hypothetical protein
LAPHSSPSSLLSPPAPAPAISVSTCPVSVCLAAAPPLAD